MPTAAFLAAGGYHHHIGFNVWRGVGVPPMPADTVGMRHWTVVLDSATEVSAVADRLTAAGIAHEPVEDGMLVRDPWNNAAIFTTAPGDA
jgi:catechol 2,3-dioxygenase